MEIVDLSLFFIHTVCYYSTLIFLWHVFCSSSTNYFYFFFLYGSSRLSCFPAPINIYFTKEWLRLSHEMSCVVMGTGVGMGASWVALRRRPVHGSNSNTRATALTPNCCDWCLFNSMCKIIITLKRSRFAVQNVMKLFTCILLCSVNKLLINKKKITEVCDS